MMNEASARTRKINIGDAAHASGVSAKMIRHYEEIGLIPKAKRSASGYRLYDESDVYTLQFVRTARTLGFSMTEIKKLLGLWRNKARKSTDVKAMALSHIGRLESKIQDLQKMVDTLRHLANRCHGDHRPECPIIDAVATGHSILD